MIKNIIQRGVETQDMIDAYIDISANAFIYNGTAWNISQAIEKNEPVYYVEYNVKEDRLSVCTCDTSFLTPMAVYYKTEKDAQASIDKFRDNYIKMLNLGTIKSKSKRLTLNVLTDIVRDLFNKSDFITIDKIHEALEENKYFPSEDEISYLMQLVMSLLKLNITVKFFGTQAYLGYSR